MNPIKSVVKNKLVKNSIWIIGGKIIQMILSFVISIITARYLGPSNFGIINYVHSFFVFSSCICGLGFDSIIVNEFVRKPDDESETLGTVMVLETISAFFSIIGMVLLVGLANQFDKQYCFIALIYSLSMLFKGVDMITYWYQAHYLSKVSSIAGIIAYIVMSAYRIFLLATGKSIEWFAFSNTVDAMILALGLFVVFKKNYSQKLKFSWKRGKEMLSRSYHFIISGLMITIYMQTDKVMLKHMVDEATVGNYSVAASISTIWVFVLTAVIDSARPYLLDLYTKNKKRFEQGLQCLYTLIIAISVCVALIFTIFGDFLINLLYGDAYSMSGLFLAVLSWSIPFSYIGASRNIFSLSEGLERYEKHMALIGTLMNVILNFVLINLVGAVGAAIATLITQIFINYIVMFMIKPLRKNGIIITKAFNPISTIMVVKDIMKKRKTTNEGESQQ